MRMKHEVDAKIYTSLVRMEYHTLFDTFVSRYAKEIGYNLEAKDYKRSLKEIIKLRKDAMVDGYFKYGAIYDNYAKNSGMRPYEDAHRRFEAYSKTKNLAHLIDALNFLMLGFYAKGLVINKLEDMEVFDGMFDLAIENDIANALTFYLEYYCETGEIEYFGLTCVLALWELQHSDNPMEEEHENIAIAGYCIKDIRKDEENE